MLQDRYDTAAPGRDCAAARITPAIQPAPTGMQPIPVVNTMMNLGFCVQSDKVRDFEAVLRTKGILPLSNCLLTHSAQHAAFFHLETGQKLLLARDGYCRLVHAIISRPLDLTSASNLSAIGLGCLSPHSHFEISPAVTPICAANTA